jgi:Asp/Glu/hydantoin racemase
MQQPEPQARIALIHALEESVAPARAAFATAWPEAYCFDLLDTSLAVDRAKRGMLDQAMFERFRALANYAKSSEGLGGRTSGILFTCSAFGPAIDAVKAVTGVPVLRPNESAFEEALEVGSRLGLIVSFGPSLDSLEGELSAMAAERGQAVSVRSVLADGALAALKRGDGATHDRLVADAARRLADVDVVILGQFSLARARAEIERHTGPPIVTMPESAAQAMRRRIMAPGSTSGANDLRALSQDFIS